MVTAITLGTFFNSNGKNVLGGTGGSGVDTQALLNSLLQVKAAPAIALQQKIAKNDEVASALSEFKQLFETFQSVANNLRNPPGVSNAASNAFAYNSVSVTSNTSTAGSTYLSVSASPGVTPQNFIIDNIVSIAATAKQTSSTLTIADADTAGLVVASGAAAGQFNAGTFTLAHTNGVDDVEITLETDDTLNDIVQKFVNVANQTGITAGVVQVSTGTYAINFNALQSGLDYAFDLEDPGTVTADVSGVLSQITFTTTQIASDAIFDLDGITIQRSTNAISDAVDGITFNLLQVPVDPTIITAAITVDTATARTSIVALADAYNALKEFEAQQIETNDDGTFADTAILATNQLFRSTLNTITTQVLTTVEGLASGAPNDITDIGITFATVAATSSTPEIRNVLTIDTTVLDTFLASNFSQVRDLFEFRFTSDNTNLQVFSRTNALSINNFTLDIDPFAVQVTETLTVADADTQIAFTTPTDGQLGEGDITINGATISIVDGDTLNTILAKFVAEEANTGVEAVVTETSPGQFTLTFNSTRQTGKVNLFDITAATQDASGVFANVEVTATASYQAIYDPGTGDIVIDLDGTAIAGGGGYLLTGQDGTVLEGLELIYASEASVLADVTATQGLADTLYNISEGLLEADGSLDAELEAITDEDTRLESQIAVIEDRVERYRDVLLQKFAALEQAIFQVNSLLQVLAANDEARQLASG